MTVSVPPHPPLHFVGHGSVEVVVGVLGQSTRGAGTVVVVSSRQSSTVHAGVSGLQLGVTTEVAVKHGGGGGRHVRAAVLVTVEVPAQPPVHAVWHGKKRVVVGVRGHRGFLAGTVVVLGR